MIIVSKQIIIIILTIQIINDNINNTNIINKLMAALYELINIEVICHPDSVQSAKGSFRFEAGLPGEKANSTSVCPNWG